MLLGTSTSQQQQHVCRGPLETCQLWRGPRQDGATMPCRSAQTASLSVPSDVHQDWRYETSTLPINNGGHLC